MFLHTLNYIICWFMCLCMIICVSPFYSLLKDIFLFQFFNSPGIMLLILTKASGHVPLKILSIEDGTVLKSFNHLLHRNKKVDFIEQFNEKLLVKQENENLQILDVRIFLITIFFVGIRSCTSLI